MQRVASLSDIPGMDCSKSHLRNYKKNSEKKNLYFQASKFRFRYIYGHIFFIV